MTKRGNGNMIITESELREIYAAIEYIHTKPPHPNSNKVSFPIDNGTIGSYDELIVELELDDN